jgi:hypothetical protein
LRAALDPTIARKARRGEFVKYLDHFDLLQRVFPVHFGERRTISEGYRNSYSLM